MTSATWYLVFAIVSLACTAVAMRPPHRPAGLMAATFFTAWLTTELALWIIFWQIVITAAFVAFGALDSWPGWLGLALTVVSCAGLARIVRDARATGRIFATALDDGLGAGWGNTLNPDLVRPPHRFEWRRVVLPFAPKRSTRPIRRPQRSARRA